ncbi:MAG: LamG domain-containing protein [Acidobacteria bacterium]|nr:LamG domain-containing protein [Acidobacteriota bacterium]
MIRFLISCGLLSFIETASAQQAGRCVPPPAGLAAWFTFDEPLFRGPLAAPGHVGQGLQLDGKQQHWTVPASQRNWEAGRGDFTLELWVRVANPPRTMNIVDKRDAQPHGYLIYATYGRAGFQVSNEGEVLYALDADRTLNDKQWHHLAGVARRLPTQPLLLYIDGKLKAKSTRNSPLGNLDSGVELWLGRHHRNSVVRTDDIYFDGAIDELAFYRKALSPEEIQGIYRAGRFGKCTPLKH